MEKHQVYDRAFNYQSILDIESLIQAGGSLVRIEADSRRKGTVVKGTGFLLRFKISEKDNFDTLVTTYQTYNQMVGKESINLTKLVLYLAGDTRKYIVQIDNQPNSESPQKNRIIYFFPDENLTIIQILPEDDVYELDGVYLEAEQTNKSKGYYKNKNVFVLLFNDQGNTSFSPGVINYISSDNGSEFGYTAGTNEKCIGCPIVLPSLKVIGIHRGLGEEKKEEMNFGTFIQSIVSKINKSRNGGGYAKLQEGWDITGEELSLTTKCVVRVRGERSRYAFSGCFLKVQYGRNKFYKVLVTNSQVLSMNKNKRDFSEKKKISLKIIYDDGYIHKPIHIDTNPNKKSFYFGKDLAVIKVTPDHEIDDEYFLEIDPNFYETKKWIHQTIYLMHYPEGKFNLYPGQVSGVNTGDGDFIHNCETTTIESSGGPIISGNDFKLMGIHMGRSNKSHKAYGVFITTVLRCLKEINFDEENNNSEKNDTK